MDEALSEIMALRHKALTLDLEIQANIAHARYLSTATPAQDWEAKIERLNSVVALFRTENAAIRDIMYVQNIVAFAEKRNIELSAPDIHQSLVLPPEFHACEQIAENDAGCCRIRQIPGIGPIVATAIVAAIGNGAAFRKGRDFAAWLGLVPRQYSTGGNIYLRKILIHGARAAAMRIKRDRFPIGAWMNALEARAPRNVLVVAMANKLARIAWVVLSSGEDYRPSGSLAAA